MWKTTFIQFFKLIRQNKFFTFLNLFGVSITIMIILIAAIKIESTIWPGGPEKNNKNMIFMNRLLITSEESMNLGGLNDVIIEDYLVKMEEPEAIAFSGVKTWNYIGYNGVEEYNIRTVNADWWQVFNFDFVDGRPFNEGEVLDANLVVVIDQHIKNRFFRDKKAIGEMLEIDSRIYKVVGVVENVPTNCKNSFANIYMPYTLMETKSGLMSTGMYGVTLLGSGKNSESIIAEIESIRKRLIPLLEEGFDLSFGNPTGPFGSYLHGGWGYNPQDYAGDTNKILSILGKFLLLLLLPALNLISIQLIRIHERSEEIGVRKAFGASRGELIKQILYENTLLTFLGAILGLIMTLLIVYGFTDFISQILFSDFNQNNENIQLHINLGLFLVVLISSMILSLISGIIPAIKMSRLHAVEALKGGEL